MITDNGGGGKGGGNGEGDRRSKKKHGSSEPNYNPYEDRVYIREEYIILPPSTASM